MIEKTFVTQALQANHLFLTDEIVEKLISYLGLLRRWNQVFNLTAIRDPQEMVYLHLLDSLVIHPYLHGNRIIDVGTGAGLPGIPLALIFPDKQFFLLDSNAKKTRFLKQVVTELKMKNIDIVHSRCETFHPEICFDTVISRAFASLPEMLVKTAHLVCNDGIFLAMKGIVPDKEMANIAKSFTITKVVKLDIVGLSAQRSVICIEKRREHG